MAQPILTIEGLKKSFRSDWWWDERVAVENLSLSLSPGQAHGFLGANGAGKTTTIKCVLGLLTPTAGRITFAGRELHGEEARRHIGYLPELPYFYDYLTVEETLDYFARLYGITHNRKNAVRSTLERVGLDSRLRDRVRSLSKGLQQRLGVAQAIIHRPALLFLDEPFSGLDPIGRAEMRTLFQELHREGTCLFLSSHILSDVQSICDSVSVMVRGELVSHFQMRDIGRLFGERFELTLSAPSPALLSAEGVVKSEGNTSFLFHDAAAAQSALLRAVQEGETVLQFRSTPLQLEEVFLALSEGRATTAALATSLTSSPALATSAPTVETTPQPLAVTPSVTPTASARKVLAVAQNTYRELLRGRILFSVLFLVAAIVGVVSLFGSVTIGGLVGVVQDFSTFALSFFGALLTVVSGVTLFSKEFTEKTIYNILSKPISRWHFVLGKFFGLTGAMATANTVMALGFSLLLLLLDAPLFPLVHALGLSLLECTVIAAVVLFFSSFVVTPILSGLFAFAIYLIGHSLPAIAHFLMHHTALLSLLDLLLPDLTLYLPSSAPILTTAPLTPLPFTTWPLTTLLLYTLTYTLTLLLLASLLFSRREVR